MKALSILITFLVCTTTALACPKVSGHYEKIPGSDYHNAETPEEYIYFSAETFDLIQSTTDCKVTMNTSGDSFTLKYDARTDAFIYQWDVAWYKFGLRIKPSSQGVSLTYSRSRNFLEGVAPVFTHSADFKRETIEE